MSTQPRLRFRPLGIDTQMERVVYMRSDCPVCLSEGFEALTRVRVFHGQKMVIASLNVITSEALLEVGEIGLSRSAREELRAKPGDLLEVRHMVPITSLSWVRAKIFGKKLDRHAMHAIVDDIQKGIYSSVHLSAFITACVGDKLDLEEIEWLTESMVDTGERITWREPIIADKHCVGGLPGNRTTPIVVSIIASAGLYIPKTSSKAITSPAGTADTMQVFTEVHLPMQKIQQVVHEQGGCMAWGGLAKLSPADDILIRVEKALEVDSEGQLVASVLSKKAAAGSTHLVVDIPVGETAKVRSDNDAQKLKYLFTVIGKKMGIQVDTVITDGSQPVGRGIGPALEAKDVLSVLRGETDAPTDLRDRAIVLAGALLELTEKAKAGQGRLLARELLYSGKAYHKFVDICRAQGRFSMPGKAPFTQDIASQKQGKVIEVDNRRLAKLAKLAGAPSDPTAGVEFHCPIGTWVEEGQTLLTIHSEAKGELNYALNYLESEEGRDIIRIAR